LRNTKKIDQNETESSPHGSISSSEYTRDYYLSSCQGHEEFVTTKGRILPLRLSLPLKLADLSAGMQVVDIGCGRGEIILQCAKKGSYAWGFDYAYPALELANEAIHESNNQEYINSLGLQQANAVNLPFKNNSADVVFMLDVVEHLVPDELKKAFSEIWRVLKPGGKLIIHTMPNLWYYRFGYPVYRLVQRLRGEMLPTDPRMRWTYSHVHVNEQTPRSLKRTLLECGFQTRVWLQSTVSYEYENSLIVRRGMEFLTKVPPFQTIFCNDIFAVGLKK
jgi:ubiquinone/menaquinone biosynthesis C-methylase UbiE